MVRVTLSARLQEYLARKNYTNIVVELVDSATSTSGFADVVCRPVNAKGARIVEPQVVRRLQSEFGDVLVTQRALEYDEEIFFDLKSFLGIKDITVDGIRAYRI